MLIFLVCVLSACVCVRAGMYEYSFHLIFVFSKYSLSLSEVIEFYDLKFKLHQFLIRTLLSHERVESEARIL